MVSAPRRLPAVGESRGIHVPPIAKHTRADGSRVWTVEHRGLPVVCLSVVYPIGSAGDPLARFGLTSLTADLAGTARDTPSISRQVSRKRHGRSVLATVVH